MTVAVVAEAVRVDVIAHNRSGQPSEFILHIWAKPLSDIHYPGDPWDDPRIEHEIQLRSEPPAQLIEISSIGPAGMGVVSVIGPMPASRIVPPGKGVRIVVDIATHGKFKFDDLLFRTPKEIRGRFYLHRFMWGGCRVLLPQTYV